MTQAGSGPTKDFRDFLLWERESRDTIDFKKIYVDMAADLKGGLLLSQIIYWRLPRKDRDVDDSRLSIEKHGRRWLAKADAEWYAEIRLTATEARAARLVLEARGLITCKTMRFYGDPTTHITVNEERFTELWTEMLNTPVEVRNAGRMGDKVKRSEVTKARKPGSKPTSGFRRAKAGDEVSGSVPSEDDPGEESRYYENHNNGIMETTKTGLSEPQKPDYENGNNPITETIISLTESPAEIPAETPTESTSSTNQLEGDARAHEVPGAAAAVEPEPEEDPLLDELVRGTGGAPDGAGPHGPNAGDAPPSRVPVQPQALQAARPVTTSEKVPPAAAPKYAMLALQPIPRAELDARAPRGAGVLLKALLNASSPKRQAHLQAYLGGATQTGGVPRDLLLRLTDEELLAAQAAAKADAHHPGGMTKFSHLALDRLIGAPITQAVIEGTDARTPEPGGAAYRVTNEPRQQAQVERAPEPSEPAEDYRVGAQWRRRDDGQLVTIQEVQGAKRVLSDGTTIELFRLVQRYAFHAVAPADAVAS